MDTSHTLPITYKGKALNLPLRILPGYGLRFAVLVQGAEVIFEKDESNEYRALLYPDQDNSLVAEPGPVPEPALLQAILEVLQALED